MIRLSLLHIRYVFTKYPKVVCLIAMILLGIVLFICSPISHPKSYVSMFHSSYLNAYQSTSYFYIQFILIMVTSYIGNAMMMSENQSYDVYFLNALINREDMMISKIIAMGIIVGSFVYINYLLYLGIGLLTFESFVIQKADYIFFFHLFLELYLYTCLSMLLMHGLKAYFSSMIVVIIYVIMNVQSDISYDNTIPIWTRISHYVVPTIIFNNREYVFLYGSYHTIVIIFVLIVCHYVIARYKNYY